MSLFEWLGRVIMLVLAGMITLSIISALAAISSSSGLPRPTGFERARPASPQFPAEPGQSPDERTEIAARGDPERSVDGGDAQLSTTLPAEPQPVSLTQWLEAITYVLLALAGLAALGCLLLWRLLHQQRRIADALSAAPPPSFAPPSAA